MIANSSQSVLSELASLFVYLESFVGSRSHPEIERSRL